MNGQPFGKEANVACIGIMNLPAISGSAGVLAGETHNPPAGMPALPGSWKSPTTLLARIGTLNSTVRRNLFGVPPSGGPDRLKPGHQTLGSWRTDTMRLELTAFVAIIVLLNLPLLKGACAVGLIFLPDRVAAGEWWRLFTYSFVHVSWYHLLLDATAFLILYQGLAGRNAFERMGFVFAGGAGSLLTALWNAPILQTHGLCGLSGIAHGLMAVSALDQVKAPMDKNLRCAGAATFSIVVAKSMIEAATGRIAFEYLHFGALGSPVAVCHAGGVLGGVGAWLFVQASGAIRSSRKTSTWCGAHLETAIAGPRTVPVRSSIAGGNSQECSRTSRPSDVQRAGTARAPGVSRWAPWHVRKFNSPVAA